MKRIMRNRRKYTDRDKAAALAALDANEGNCYKTAAQLKIPRQTLTQWAEGAVSADVPQLRQEKKQELADMCEELARKLCGAMLEDNRIESARYGELNAGFGTATDKMQLLRQLPTQIIDVSRLTDEQLQRIAAGENPNHIFAASGSGGAGTQAQAESESIH